MIATPMPAFFSFFLVRRFGTGLSTRVVTVVRVLWDVSAIAFSLLLFYGFTKVATMVEFPPAVTVIVRCQGVISSFSIEIWCSPGVNWIVDGVLPIYLPSTFMSQPGGVDFTAMLAGGCAGSACELSAAAAGSGCAIAGSEALALKISFPDLLSTKSFRCLAIASAIDCSFLLPPFCLFTE